MKNSLPADKYQTKRKQNPFLLFSTLALICLSLSKDWRFTVGLGIMWISLYVVTVRSPEKMEHNDLCFRKSTRSYVAAFILVVLFFNFFYTLTTGNPMELWESFGITSSVATPVLLFLGVVGSIVGYHALCVYSQYFILLFLPIIDVAKKMYKQYFALAAIYLCGLFAIIRSNFYYIDDLGRNVEGYSLAGSFSRYVSSYFATVVHGNGWLTDISPLPQILAALIMALAAIITLYVVSERTDFHIADIICLVPFGLSPYFLDCLSYKYDAPYMALSVLAAVFPLLFRRQSTTKYLISIIVGTILVCTTYQVSAAVFPLCVAFLCFMSWNRGEDLKETFSFLFKSAGGFLAGVLFFRIILMEPVTEGGYVSSAISLRSFPINIYEYATRILEDFNLIWLVLIFLVVIGFIVAAYTSTKQKKVPALLMTICALIVMFILSYGLYSFLRNPLTSARSMYGFGILLSLLCYYVVSNSKIRLSRAAVCLLAWLVFVFAFTYGNALSSQKEYADFRTEQVLTDLSRLDLMDDPSPKLFAVSGTIGFAESVENMLPMYPVLSDLIPILLSDSEWYWGAYQLEHYYGIDNLTRDTEQIVQAQTDLVLLADSIYHTIRGNDDFILIELK